MRRLCVAAVLVVLANPVSLSSQSREAGGRARVERTDQPVVVDGRDTDAVWSRAQRVDEFRQFAPTEDGAPTYRTEVRAAYDDRRLYVFVRAFDPHPDSLLALLSRRDVRTNSDQLKIIIDGYRDRRTGIELMVNPAGVKRDAAIYSDIVEDMTWDGIWDVGVTIDSLGWTAEFAVPFSQVRFNAGTSGFGFGVWRDIARLNERVSWPTYRTSSQTLASQLGTLEGFTGLTRASRLELLPYTVTKNVTEVTQTGWDHPQKVAAGIDVKYGLTSNLTLDATVNPDFGQVEADPAILNLTAFEVRFEERRPFFQEGGGLFRCGGPCEGIFYTRRIGRTPQLRSAAADPVSTTILGAGKLTGRLGNGLSLGLVEAVTRREVGIGGRTIEPRTNYLVARAVKELRQGRSSFGLMATAVNRDLDAETSPFLRRDAFTVVAQGFHRFARESWEVMGYTGRNIVRGSEEAIARTQLSSVHYYQRPGHEETFDPTRTSLGGGVIGGSLSKLRGQVRYSNFVRAAGPGLELNDLGFVPLVNDISVRQTLSFQGLRPTRLYRRTFNSLTSEQHWTTGGLPAGSNVTLHTSAEFPNFWGAAFTYRLVDIGASHCMSCARGGPAVRQSAKHDFSINIQGDPRPAFVPSLDIGFGHGDEQNSYGIGIGVNLEMRIASRFSMSFGPNYVHRNDDQQWVANFGAALSDTTHYTFAHMRQRTYGFTTRANWTLSPTLSFQFYGQPFLSTGHFTDWRELANPLARDYDARFRRYGGGANPPGFNVKQFNSNAVVRWEYRPGSALFVVWQQGRAQGDRNIGTFDWSRDLRDLFDAHPDNTLLVKASWWLNP
ncbi:MAG: carbohydrate binding family 9 domain-containing protein [Gemmatimonadetes bacterium]|nr:carbohydrate binding family 9 domain-containing protein [Gemmatimonadota bacterium]